MKWFWLFIYVLAIVLANWLVVTFGIVPVGFGLMAPAGIYAVGLIFTLRDIIHEHFGVWIAFAAVTVGALLSALLSPALALASFAAFFVSETSDLLVYTPLRERNKLLAVGASNIVGLVVDSVLFLLLAFGSLTFLLGQVVGKAWMTLLALAVLYKRRRVLRPA